MSRQWSRHTIRAPHLALALLVASGGARSTIHAQGVLAFRHARLVDGAGGAVIADATVVIRGDRIVAAGPASAVSVPAGARVIEARGRTLIPGLADLHVHLTGGWDGETTDLLGFPRYLNALLYAGVTTVLDVGNVLPYVQQMRQEIAAGRLAGPRLYMAGALVDGPTPFWPPISYAVSSPSQIPVYVKQLRSAGVDVVKGYGGLTTEQLGQLADAARQESLRLVVDAHARNGTAEVAKAGIAAFAHLGTVPVSDETVAIMQERGVANITTLAVYESFARRRFADTSFISQPLLAGSMPPLFREELAAFATKPQSARAAELTKASEARLRTAMANAKRLFDAGVLLTTGTDSPYPGDFYGEGLHRELELLVEAGLTPLQAITLATRNAARFMRDTTWGTIEPGKRADVLLIDGRPDERIAETRNIVMVVQGGRVLDRASLRLDPKKDPGYRTGAAISSGQ
jgi:imidazolonepropionase-like amidohydrolase